ncbi:MAG: DUF420 domain-containing protein [Cyclobacteriaceae bacterium]|nr:DUF420 domain-containing protein [Cyclobacteriaceae bacterium]
MEGRDLVFKRFFIFFSIVVPLLVAALVFMPKGDPTHVAPWIYTLPFFNAIINSLTAMLLVLGVVFVKSGRVQSHKISMGLAFLLGSLFLVFYVIYHGHAPATSFGGIGWVRYAYFFLLISHILLAMVVVPLVLMAVYFGVFQKIEQHRKIVRYTFPVWLYVSITGVIVYIMISPYYVH